MQNLKKASEPSAVIFSTDASTSTQSIGICWTVFLLGVLSMMYLMDSLPKKR